MDDGKHARQSQAGQQLVGRDDDQARASFVAIEDTARTALVEMRRLLGMLRDDNARSLAPQPGLTQLGDLIAGVGEAGLAVSIDVDGHPVKLAPGLDLSAYRIVQEALTNTLKHSEASSARVRVQYDLQRIQLTGEDDGARELFVGDATIKTHLTRILMKLNLRDRVQAVVLAYESGLITPGTLRHEL